MAPSIYQDLFADINSGADAEDINQFKKVIAANDYYRRAAAPLLNAKFDTSTWSPGEAVGVTALQAFLGSALNTYGQKQEARQLEAVAPYLPALYKDPLNTVLPESVDPEARAGLRVNAITKKAEQEALVRSALYRDVFGTDVANKAYINRVKELAPIESEQALALEEIKRGMAEPERSADMEDKLRAQFLGQKTVQDFGQISTQFAALQKAANDPTAVSDLDYIYGIAKILDPQAVVRESDAGAVIDSQSIPTSILGTLNKYITGDPAIRSKGRQSFLDLAQRRYDIQKEAVDLLANDFRTIASDRGVRPERAVVIPGAPVASRNPRVVNFGELETLAKSFPNTPEGRAAFKQKVAELESSEP